MTPGRRRSPRTIYLANGLCAGREVPETVIRAGRDSFVVEHRPPGSPRAQQHRYALVDDGMYGWKRSGKGQKLQIERVRVSSRRRYRPPTTWN